MVREVIFWVLLLFVIYVYVISFIFIDYIDI